MKLSYIFAVLLFTLLAIPSFAHTKVDLANGMMITLPHEFTVAEEKSFISKDDNVHVNIIEIDMEEEISKQEVVDEIIHTLKQQWDSYEVIEQGDFKQLDYQAVFIKGKMHSDEAGINIVIAQYLILAGDKLYNINCACPESIYGKYSKLFDEIAGSFRKK